MSENAEQLVVTEFAAEVERIAFSIPAPNPWTPQLIMLAQAARRRVMQNQLKPKRDQ